MITHDDCWYVWVTRIATDSAGSSFHILYLDYYSFGSHDACKGNRGTLPQKTRVASAQMICSCGKAIDYMHVTLEIIFVACEDMTSVHTTMLGEWHRDQRDQQGFSNRDGGPKLIRFESPMGSPNQVRVHLGVQKQHALKMMPKPHTESNLSVLYMRGKIIS